ncbi:MAG TPA: acyl-CoA dehydrogenase [Rubricoccaceae bacterium]
MPSLPDPLAGVPRGVAAYLPFLSVAWADGRLSPGEVAALRAHVAEQAWLTDAERSEIGAALDPASPPDAATVHGWTQALRTALPYVSAEARGSLAALGAALAALAGDTSGDGAGVPPEVRTSLDEVERALGVDGAEAVREMAEAPPATEPPALPPAVPPAFDVTALQAVLDSPHADVRDRVRTLLSDPFFAYPEPGLLKEAYRDLVLRWTRRLAEEGVGSLAFPVEVGGEGSIGRFIAAFETLAFHDLSLVVKYGVQFGLWGGSVQQLGGEAQRAELLPEIASLRLPGAFAMSERDHGSNVRDLKTTATLDRATDEWVVQTPTERDHKEWIGSAAAHARVASVFAQLVIDGEGYGVHAFLVPLRDEAGGVLPGVRIEDSGHKMGLNGVDNGRIWFDAVRVPRTALLDRFAQVSADGVYTSPIPSEGKRFFVMLGTLVGGRIAVGSAANSAAKAGLTIAVRYGARRRQFGPSGGPEVPLMDYLSHQRRLLPLVATSTALTFALHDLAETFAALPPGGDTREIESDAAALKALASAHSTRALQEAREATGGEGYRWTSRIAHRKADADIFTTFEGDNTVLLLQVAKGLLAGYQQEFHDLNVSGIVRFLRDRADARLGEVNPVTRHNAAPEHLLDPAWHRALFERRERQLLVSAAARLKGRIDRKTDSFDAFVEVQDHLLTLARAHGERLVLRSFQAAVERTADEQIRKVLSLQCGLYALSRIEADRGWFLEQNLFEGNVAKAVRTQVNALLERLRPIAVEIVDAFGIPDALLGSDIATAADAPGPPPDVPAVQPETEQTGAPSPGR